MTPAAPPAAEAPKVVPEPTKAGDKMARRSGPRYQFVGFGQEEPAAKVQPAKEPAKPEPPEAEAASPAKPS